MLFVKNFEKARQPNIKDWPVASYIVKEKDKTKGKQKIERKKANAESCMSKVEFIIVVGGGALSAIASELTIKGSCEPLRNPPVTTVFVSISKTLIESSRGLVANRSSGTPYISIMGW